MTGVEARSAYVGVLLEVVGVLAEGQGEGVQGVPEVLLGAEEKGQQVEGVQVVPTQRQRRLQRFHGCR